jgi:hypothetical protein
LKSAFWMFSQSGSHPITPRLYFLSSCYSFNSNTRSSIYTHRNKAVGFISTRVIIVARGLRAKTSNKPSAESIIEMIEFLE